jgi:hypothetical protein
MKYILMDYVREAGWPLLPDDDKARWLGVYLDYVDAMKQAGILLNAAGLKQTSSATTVRVVNGQTQVLDGPYADTKEQLGGFHIIDVPDLDTALSWAARCPTALHGVVEVRPLQDASLNEIRAQIAAKGDQ